MSSVQSLFVRNHYCCHAYETVYTGAHILLSQSNSEFRKPASVINKEKTVTIEIVKLSLWAVEKLVKS